MKISISITVSATISMSIMIVLVLISICVMTHDEPEICCDAFAIDFGSIMTMYARVARQRRELYQRRLVAADGISIIIPRPPTGVFSFITVTTVCDELVPLASHASTIPSI
jgi:hypothetical protein